MTNFNSLNIALIGAGGKMGQIMISLIGQHPDINLVAAIEHPEFKELGNSVHIQSNHPSELVFESIQNLDLLLSNNQIDVCVDFSHPESTTKWAPIFLRRKIPIVIATTGLSEHFINNIQEVAKLTQTSLLISTNMAFGMNIFIKMAKEIAKFIPNWDIEIIEKHHHHKLDSPSGTALTIANEIKEVVAKDFKSDDMFTFGRGKGRFPRKFGNKEIGIHAVRAGDIVGEHTVIFAGAGERIEFTHQAQSRNSFAEGALNAARFLTKVRNQGRLFNISDVIEYAKGS
ncbi:MAG: 4-hydroxy-tetrahydrodipicolinate reductase [Promethearchaeota archaeon]|nr:MAG: 4-hydroxy-tetrahydrodipicolinate reductase [Candidatus Lokiarchaeota archaeon]